jgi:hypothetical protein
MPRYSAEGAAHAANSFRQKSVSRLLSTVLEIAELSQPVTLEQFMAAFECSESAARNRLLFLSALPWVQIQAVPHENKGACSVAFSIKVDHDVKNVCDLYTPGPTRESPNVFYKRLLSELITKRKEAETRNRGAWVPENTAKRRLVDILDWLQTELYQFTAGGRSINGRGAAITLPQAQEVKHGEENQVRTGPADAGPCD